MDTLDAMRVFTAVAERSGFSAAADALDRSTARSASLRSIRAAAIWRRRCAALSITWSKTCPRRGWLKVVTSTFNLTHFSNFKLTHLS
ncbi:hypothetical protein XcvCFBP7113P_16875 [Xanthomonas citri pv. vignicola]|nr:hypothetical protein XcvCFBP7113P_16875 [Xanthomonas citri pv. vignicola]